jgi:transcriptional regulator with XRE-family HTH domain
MKAERLRKLRISKGISQEHLANVLGVKQQTIGKWEKAVTVPRLPMLQKIANYFDVTTDYLTGLSDIPHTSSEKAIQVTATFDTQRVLTAEDISLLEAYHRASDRDKNIVDAVLKPSVACASKEEIG